MPVGVESAPFAVEPVSAAGYRADAECRVAATRAAHGVEQTFVVPEKKKVYAAQGDCRKSGTRIFTRDYRQQATCQGQEKNGQPERMDRLVAQVPQTPERQRDAHARYGRYAADADQQEIVVHNNYQDACPSAYLSGSCGVWRYKKRGTKL